MKSILRKGNGFKIYLILFQIPRFSDKLLHPHEPKCCQQDVPIQNYLRFFRCAYFSLSLDVNILRLDSDWHVVFNQI